MEKRDISCSEFIERMGLLGGLGAAYCSMAQFALPPLSYAHSGAPRPDRRSGEGQHIVILGAGMQAGILRPKIDLNELLDSEFWKSGLFNDMYLYWQTGLMQPEG